jgi:solute carrier family 6 amino acid transporter-like protein 5/7/9/14
VFGIAIVGFSIGLVYTTPGGQHVLSFLDFYGASFVGFLLAIAELITVGWIYGEIIILSNKILEIKRT